MPSASTLRYGKAVIELGLTGNKEVEKQLKRVEARMRDFGRALKSIGTSGVKFSGAVAGLLAFPVKMAVDLEKTRAEFTALLADASKASTMLSQIEAFALVTPLGAQELRDAARTMLNFGVASESVVPILKRLGEIAGGDAERMSRLALAFGQVNAKGRLMAQEVNQMVEAGFNPLQEISRTTGESMNSLMKRMEAGGIGVGKVQKAFASATSAGGRFSGLLDKIANTTVGQFNNLRESIVLAVRPLGEALLPAINDVLSTLTGVVPMVAEWVKNNQGAVIVLAKVALGVGVVSAGLVALGTVFGSLAKTIGGVTLAAKGLSVALAFITANPIVAGLTAIAAAVMAIAVAFDNATPSVQQFGEGVEDAITRLEKKLADVKRQAEENAKRRMPLPKSAYNQAIAELESEIARLKGELKKKDEPTPDGIKGPASAGGKGKRGFWETLVRNSWVDVQAKAMRAQFEAMGPIGAAKRWIEGEKQAIEFKRQQEEAKAAAFEIADSATPQRMMQQQAVFDARMASQIFGGSNEQTQLLRDIKRNTDPRNSVRQQDFIQVT